MGVSSSVPSWLPELASSFEPLVLRTCWTSDKVASAARLSLTVCKEDGTKVMSIDGGYVYKDGGICIPTDAVISLPDGGKCWRAVCNRKQHDTWSWTLQTSRTVSSANGTTEHECSVCWSPFYRPVRFPAKPEAACSHVFCRECVVRCLSSGQSNCPLCRAPIVEGMTPLKAKSLPSDDRLEANIRTSYSSAPVSVNFVTGNPATVWTAPSDLEGAPGEGEGGGRVLPAAISVKPMEGWLLAWGGAKTPKSLKTMAEADRASLYGFASTRALVRKSPGKTKSPRRVTAGASQMEMQPVREMVIGVKPELLHTASKEDLALFLAILTEAFWSRGGHGNVHVAQNPWGGPRQF